MKKRHLLVSACAAAMAIGGFTGRTAGAQGMPAQAPAIYVSEFHVIDADGIRPYSEAVESTFSPFGGRYIVRGGKVTSLEGIPTKRIVMIEFPSLAQAHAWYASPAYAALKPIRHRYAESKVFIVEGVTR